MLLKQGKDGEGARELEAVEALLRRLSPDARILRCEHSDVPLDAVLNTHAQAPHPRCLW